MMKIIGTKTLKIMERLPNSEVQNKYSKARKRIKEIKGFYQHLFAYILFIPFTTFINYQTYWDYKWFWYPLLGWGLGVIIHGFCVFVHKGKFGSNWEARKIEALIRKEENN